ncbi:hypothetical protein [uncultured Rhodoblastus sp.]|uniref:hypothetical protein n=1 Tax=uncultured Rhodoblastus sp. TaxID=543037 RepID=UPI0025E76650|nr:hypothetical protein [uncultured Rhodoblastus sp.]
MRDAIRIAGDFAFCNLGREGVKKNINKINMLGEFHWFQPPGPSLAIESAQVPRGGTDPKKDLER